MTESQWDISLRCKLQLLCRSCSDWDRAAEGLYHY